MAHAFTQAPSSGHVGRPATSNVVRCSGSRVARKLFSLEGSLTDFGLPSIVSEQLSVPSKKFYRTKNDQNSHCKRYHLEVSARHRLHRNVSWIRHQHSIFPAASTMAAVRQ